MNQMNITSFQSSDILDAVTAFDEAIASLMPNEAKLVVTRALELCGLLSKPRHELTRNEIARLAGVASTSVKAALDSGKSVSAILFPPPKETTKSVRLTESQLAAIKAAGIEI